MTVPSVTLSGPAILGQVVARAGKLVTKTAAKLPILVKLGRKPPLEGKTCVRFADHFHPAADWKPPAEVDWTAKAETSLLTMLGNDQYGNCVIAGKAHAVGVWTANDNDSGGEVVTSTTEAVAEYQAICGPGDNGCYITEVLDTMQRRGLHFGGKQHRIGGYVYCDPGNADLVKSAIALFGSVCFGINFPRAWQSSATWDATNSPVVGGHDVTGVRYNSRGVFVSSWGRLYLMTWAAIAQRGRVEECYAMLSPDWTNQDNLSPAGVDRASLALALNAIGEGSVPDPVPAPPPTPDPPTPPAPVWPVFTFEGSTDQGEMFSGTATPVGSIVATPTRPTPSYPDEYVLDCGNVMLATSLSAALWPVPGCSCEVRASNLHMRRGKLTPEQWAALIQAIADAVAAILAVLGSH